MSSDDMKRFEGKIDKLMIDLTEMKVLQAEHGGQLKEHMRRTDILEAKVAPVEKHVHMVNGGVKLIGLIALLAAVIKAIHWMFTTL